MKRVSIGGQAVIEGVMMKNADRYAVAVRTPEKEIEVKIEECKTIGERYAICRVPIIRGVCNFIESLVIGMKTLTYSASFYDEEVDKEGMSEKQLEKLRKQEEKENKKTEEQKARTEKIGMTITVALSIVFSVAIFMLLPAWVASFVDDYVESYFLLGLLEGVIRLIIFLTYLILISRMKDIQRTFMYHGAEHKTINCLESGKDLTVDNVMEATRFHKRCGTSFLFLVMFISILVFMWVRTDVIWLRLAWRVLLVPVIAGISYEFIRYAGKHDNLFANIVSKPGLWIQRLTTKEPEPDMVEVAIRSVDAVFDWREYLEEQRKEVSNS